MAIIPLQAQLKLELGQLANFLDIKDFRNLGANLNWEVCSFRRRGLPFEVLFWININKLAGFFIA